MKLLTVATICCLVLLTVACHTIESNARDTIAAAQGVIVQAQVQFQPQCSADATKAPCPVINQAVSAQNAAITALEAYCGFTPTSGVTEKCTPVKSLQPALTSALANLNQFVTELKGAIK